MHSFPLFFVRSALASGSGGGDCYTGQGYKLLEIDGSGGCGIYGEREEVVANR